MAIRTSAGGTFVIEVDANPTTGYLWELDLPQGLELVEQRLEPPATTAMGAGGKETYTLRADRPGEYVVRLKLRRPWESQPIETRNFAVVVNG